MSIASNLKKIRAEKGYSLEKVARLADLSLSTVVKVEDARFSFWKQRFESSRGYK